MLSKKNKCVQVVTKYFKVSYSLFTTSIYATVFLNLETIIL